VVDGVVEAETMQGYEPQIGPATRVRRGAIFGGLLSCAATLLAIGLSAGLGAMFGWSGPTEAVVWVISCSLLLLAAIAAAVSLGRRVPTGG
jgi:hypothetical protein